MKWTDFPSKQFEVCGLPWWEENSPKLNRFPFRAESQIRGPVWNLARYPAGGRIRFASNTSQLAIRATYCDLANRQNMSDFGASGLDVYVNGQYWISACPKSPGEVTLNFFGGVDNDLKEFTVYLPLFQELQIQAIGLDENASLALPSPHQKPLPVMFYGSSVVQGSGASRPGMMTYEAILARKLNLDYIDLGFGGNGRAEPEVVNLLTEINACCYVFDLGKSYGMQPTEPYTKMLEEMRNSYPEIPLICITPIYSTREQFDAEYRNRSIHTRQAATEAVNARKSAGDQGITLVEGLELLGPDDSDGFHEGIHPSDYGYNLIAQRLESHLTNALRTV